MNGSSPRADRRLFWLLATVHLGLCLVHFPLGEVFSGEPVLTSDWVHHYFEAERVAAYLRDGSFLGYATTWSAGFVDGFVGLVNNKPFGLLLAVLPEASHPVAFNLAILFSLWVFPALLYRAARSFGRSRAEAAATMGLGIACWYGSMLFRVFWRGGSVLFLDGAAMALWATGMIYARMSSGTRSPSLPATAFVCAVVPWVHSGAAVVLGIAAGTTWIVHRSRRGLRDLLLLGGVTAAASLPWIVPFLANADLRGSLDYGIYPGGLRNFWFDFVRGPLHLGPGPREETAILAGLLPLAALGAWRLRAKRAFVATLSLSAAAFLFLAYCGGTLGLGSLQPYRFVVPLAAILSIAAGGAASRLPPTRKKSDLLAASLVVLSLVVVADRLRVANRGGDYLGAGLGVTEAWALQALRTALGDDAPEGRILLEGDWLSEPVAGRAGRRRVTYSFVAFERYLDAEYIGAPAIPVLTPAEEASFWRGQLFGRPVGEYDDASFERLARSYRIAWVVTLREPATRALSRLEEALEIVDQNGSVALFRVRNPKPLGASSSDGRTIDIAAEAGTPIVLPYHWNRRLVSEPEADLRGIPTGLTPRLAFIELRPEVSGVHRIRFD